METVWEINIWNMKMIYATEKDGQKKDLLKMMLKILFTGWHIFFHNKWNVSDI